jgi:HNH endonuclease
MPHKYTPEQRISAFWNKVNKNGSIPAHMPYLGKCWEWTANINPTGGYGTFASGVGKKLIYAHRFSWLINIGQIPDGLFVLHKCDNPACVNPNHLFLGTTQDNSIDMFEKGRALRDKENNGRHKVTKMQVEEIRKRYMAGGISQQKLANEYGISQSEISYITTKTGWTE